MSLSVEYLAIFRRNDTFCNSVASFTRLIQVDSNIVVTNNSIRFKDKLVCHFQMSGGNVATKNNQRFFQLRFTWDGDPISAYEELGQFIDLLKATRRVIAQADGEVETLCDDVSGHFARLAYPMIHDIESLMRRLIANFMLVNVGLEWVDETLPTAVEDAVRKSKRKDSGEAVEVKSAARGYLNVLHTLDFIHLGDILFNPYSKKTIQDLYSRLKDTKTLEDVTALMDFIPQSNWKRYFQSLVACDDSYLESRWKKLYELRCKVAHNALMTHRDLEETQKLIGEVLPKLNDAVAKLVSVTVAPEDAELVAENAARNMNAAIGEFIGCWQHFEEAVLRRARLYGERRNVNIFQLGEMLRWSLFSEQQYSVYEKLRSLRNRIVHGPANEVPTEIIQAASAEMRVLLEGLGGEDMVARLGRMSDEDRVQDLYLIVSNSYYAIVESVAFRREIAGTNYTNFDIDRLFIQGVSFRSNMCVVLITYSFRCNCESQKVFDGSRVSGTASVRIEPDGSIFFDEVTAEMLRGKSKT